jgi:hypothetical protein
MKENVTCGVNVGIGFCALFKNNGAYNNAVGNQVLKSTTTGYENTGMGTMALCTNTTGYKNAAFGSQALKHSTTAINLTGLGNGAGFCNTTGSYNTSVGHEAGCANTTGAENTSLGYLANKCGTTGNNNTSIGASAGCQLTTGSSNVFLGHIAGRVGSPATITTQSGAIVIGNNSSTDAYIKIDWTVTSDLRDKTQIEDVPHGLDFVNQMKPIKYKFKKSRNNDTPQGDIKYGFGAQDILKLEGDNPVIINNKQDDILKITNAHLIPVLVKAIQELTEANTALTARVKTLEDA